MPGRRKPNICSPQAQQEAPQSTPIPYERQRAVKTEDGSYMFIDKDKETGEDLLPGQTFKNAMQADGPMPGSRKEL